MVSHNSNSSINDNKTTSKTSFTIWKCTCIHFQVYVKMLQHYLWLQKYLIYTLRAFGYHAEQFCRKTHCNSTPSLQRVKAIEQKLLIWSKLFNIDTIPVNYFGAMKSTCNLVLVLTELETNGTQRILLLLYKVCNRYTATC